MEPYRFKKETAIPGHGGTILSAPVFPDGLPLPFSHAWGYIENGNEMEAHAHGHPEIYMIMSGAGKMSIDDTMFMVKAGDVVHIQPDAVHSIGQQGAEPLLWAAFWWK